MFDIFRVYYISLTKYGFQYFSSGLILTGCNGIYCPICRLSKYMILLFFICKFFYQRISSDLQIIEENIKTNGNIVYSNNFFIYYQVKAWKVNESDLAWENFLGLCQRKK